MRRTRMLKYRHLHRLITWRADIHQSENAYVALEQALNSQINNMEATQTRKIKKNPRLPRPGRIVINAVLI